MIFISPSISSSLEVWWVNHISLYEDPNLNICTKVNFLVETSSKWLTIC